MAGTKEDLDKRWKNLKVFNDKNNWVQVLGAYETEWVPYTPFNSFQTHDF